MTKELFDYIVGSLGLPINGFYEYIIMLIVGEITFKFAYKRTGTMIRRGIITKRQGSEMHWTLRLFYYAVIWAFLRIGIWLFGFIKENKGVSIFAGICIIAIITTINIFKENEKRKRLLIQVDLREENINEQDR